MRLTVKQSAPVHTELTGALGWNVWNELFSCSDDQTIHKWNMLGEPEQKVGPTGRRRWRCLACTRSGVAARCLAAPFTAVPHVQQDTPWQPSPTRPVRGVCVTPVRDGVRAEVATSTQATRKP